MNRLTERAIAELQLKDSARRWGEKVGWEDGQPNCPYDNALQKSAWWDGFRYARSKKEGR
jgi:ribosome modulation factor